MQIDVHFNRSGPQGGVLVVVAVGAEVYGASGPGELDCLDAAALTASEDLARRGHRVSREAIVREGRERLSARAGRSAER